MVETLSVGVVCLILSAFLIATLYAVVVRPKRYSSGFKAFAEMNGFTYTEAAEVLDHTFEKLQGYEFFQRVGRRRIRGLVRGERDGVRLEVMEISSTTRGVDHTYLTYYTFVFLSDSELVLPRLQLRKKQAALEERLNSWLFEEEAAIELANYPTLAAEYALSGEPAASVVQLLNGSAGDLLEKWASQGTWRHVEGEGNALAVYAFQRDPVQLEELEQLVGDSLELTRVLRERSG